MRSSRVAEPQSVVTLDSADPRTGDSIAGTLFDVMAAASESTTRAFWDLVFCRMLMISAISVNVTANALTISASATNTCRFMAKRTIFQGRTKSGSFYSREDASLVEKQLERKIDN